MQALDLSAGRFEPQASTETSSGQNLAKKSELELRDLSSLMEKSLPSDIIRYALARAQRPVVFTNFRPNSIASLHLLVQERPDIPVVWIDHGLNSAHTYRYVDRVVDLLKLNLKVFHPEMSAARYLAIHGEAPNVESAEHEHFTEVMKLAPFRFVMETLKPDVWFNGTRRDQNAHRENMDIFTRGSHGTVRVAPTFYVSESQIEDYILQNDLPNNFDYVDPTKGDESRECGLMLQN